jgi:hypothetical protein
MKAEFEYSVTDVQLIANPQKTAFLLRSEVVDQPSTGPVRSGKHIHLTMTTKQAMRLLSMLQAAQANFGLEIAQESKPLYVPPAKDRN